jgi:hypothetical protein
MLYKRSLERQNKAFSKQMKILKNVSISPFFYTSCSCSVAPVGHCSPRPTILQAEVWKSKHIFNILWDVWE